MVPLNLCRAALAAALLLLPLAAAAQTAAGTIKAPELPDVKVRTGDGSEVRFRELIAGKTFAINFIFTSCPSVCPLMGASFGKVQKLLGDREVALISISVDPLTDTPARLTEWSKRFGARPGWTLVTGEEEDIDALLKAFGVYTSEPGSHSPSAIIGNEARGVWRKVDGLAPPSTIKSVIDAVDTPQRSAR